ncbi:DNA polymerase Y family protein [Candidatus Nitrospira bockiana]
MEPRIAYFHIPSLGIALLQQQDPSLRNRPIAVASTHSARARLRDVSSTAVKDGLRAGMTVGLARRLCPALRLFPPDPHSVLAAHTGMQAVMARFTPVWEPRHPGHFFLDLTGTHRLFGAAIDAATRIEREVRARYGFSGVLGLGRNKLVSHLAATVVEPPHLYEVRPGSEEPFLAPTPVALVNHVRTAFAEETLERLEELNLRTLGAIAGVALPHLEVALGPPARLLYDWAHGIDRSPVLPPVRQLRLERSITAVPEEIDDGRILGLLYGALEQLCRALRRQPCLCGRLRLTIRHSDHVEVRACRSLASPTCWESELYPVLTQLLDRAFRRRIRIRTLTLAAEAVTPGTEVFGAQLALFDPDPEAGIRRRERSRRLSTALDHLRDRFGDRAVQWGRVMSLGTHEEGDRPQHSPSCSHDL